MDEQKKGIVVLQTCMDCRQTEEIIGMFLEGKLKPDDIVVRDAGVNPAKMPHTIEQLKQKYSITKVINKPHTDCGAMKTVIALRKDGVGPEDEAISHLLSDQFAGLDFKDNGELEAYNEKLQAKMTSSCYGTKNVDSELEVITRKPPEEEHTLVISNPVRAGDYARVIGKALMTGDKLGNCYAIHGLEADVGTDIELAVARLHIHRLVFVALPGEREKATWERMKNVVHALAVKGYYVDAGVASFEKGAVRDRLRSS